MHSMGRGAFGRMGSSRGVRSRVPGSGGYRSGGSSGGGGGYRPSNGSSYRPYVRSTPVYNQAAMDALEANLDKKEAEDAARRAQQQAPYGGHPLQQQRPELQYGTVQLDNAAQYHHDHIAERYRNAHEA